MTRPFLKFMLIAVSLSSGIAQELKLPVNLDKLAERATETVDVTLDADMLRLAGSFLSKDDADEAQVKKLIGKLKGVYVRSFEFDKDGQYSQDDIRAFRAQLKSPHWSRIVGVHSAKGDNSEIYLLKEGDQIGGLVVLDAEPRALTIVHIDGPISPDDLAKLSGHMGIPEMDKSKRKNKSEDSGRKKEKDKDDDDRDDDVHGGSD